VAYPILDLNRLKFNLRSYMRWLEQVVIETLGQFGIAGERDVCATGVWVPAAEPTDAKKGPGPFSETPATSACPADADVPANAKICAMGVRVSRWVSMHGLALNVEPNLDHFKLIVPCGLAGRPVTSMRAQLGDACPGLDAVKASLAACFRSALIQPESP
jgi:lipoyl(octanoyl) transferase